MTDVHGGGNDWQLLHSQANQQMFSLKVIATGDKMNGTVALSKIQPSHQNEVLAVKKFANH